MIHRHTHGHGHGHHLHSRRSPLQLGETDHLDGLNLGTHNLLEPGDNVMQVVARASSSDEQPAGDSNTTTIVISVVLVP
jgi:hypothetical protein